MRFNKLLLLLLIVLSITSCRKDDVSDPVTTTTIPPFDVVHTYTVDVQGIVKNPNGDVISDALVNVNGQQVEYNKIENEKSIEILKSQFVKGIYIITYYNKFNVEHKRILIN